MEYLVLILIPFISALIGWFTNIIAIKSLFRPLKPINFLGLKIQGLFPKKQKKIAKTLGEVVEEYFLSHNDISKVFENEHTLNELKKEIAPLIYDKILNKIPTLFRGVATPIIQNFVDTELDSMLIYFGKRIAYQIEHKVKVAELVEQKVLEYDVENLETIMNKIAKEEFKHIEFLGAFVGFIVGLFQVGLFLLL